MKAFVVFEVDVPNDDISEQLDWYVGAIDLVRELLRTNLNPCLYGTSVKVLHSHELNVLVRK